jgi:mannose PTS system EIIC component
LILHDLLIGALVSLVCGLDRTAAVQIMICRPIVAASLTGWLLGDPWLGLQIGLLLELLWLANLPVGAAIPPDDTQIAVASSVLTIQLAKLLHTSGPELLLLCLLVAIPFGKVGQYLDHYVRQFNVRLSNRAEAALEQGDLLVAETEHLRGLLSFVAANLVTYLITVMGGVLLVPLLRPLADYSLSLSADWLLLAIPLVGVAVVVGAMNVQRALLWFSASFGTVFLLLWLL